MDGPTPWPLASGWPFIGALLGVIAGMLGTRIALLRFVGRSRYVRAGEGIEGTLLTILLIGMILLSMVQVVLRNVFHEGILWIDPLLRLGVLWLCFLGAAAATSKGRHLTIDMIPLLLPPRLRAWVRRIVSIVAAALCVKLADGGYDYLGSERQFGGEPLLGIPSWQLQSVLLLGFAFLAYRFLVLAIEGAPDDTGHAA